MREADLRPTKELTRIELVKEVYRLQDKIQVLTEKLSNQKEKPKPIKRGSYKPRVRFTTSKDTRALEWRIFNLEKKLKRYEPMDVTERMTIILNFVIKTTGISEIEIRSKLRYRTILRARSAFYYACKLSGISYQKMGNFIGRGNRTVINGRQQAEKYLSEQDFTLLDNFIKNF